MSKKPFLGISGTFFHQGFGIVFVHAKSQGRERICNQIDPENVAAFRGVGSPRQTAANMVIISPKLEDSRKRMDFFNVYINAPSLFHGLFYGRKIVVRQLCLRRFLPRPCPLFPMAIPISAAWREGASLTPSPVMATISPPLRNLCTLFTYGQGLLWQRHGYFSFLRQIPLGHFIQFLSRNALVHRLGDSRLPGYGKGCVLVISGNHGDLYSCLLQRLHGLGRFLSGRVNHTCHSCKNQISGKSFFLSFPKPVHDRPEPAPEVRLLPYFPLPYGFSFFLPGSLALSHLAVPQRRISPEYSRRRL